MELEFGKGTIKFRRELSQLDRLVIRFTKILEKQKVDYVIISGYIAILFGRSRNTEDVDIFIGEMPFAKFREFWDALGRGGFECVNESDPLAAYNDYLMEKLALRFAEKGEVIPNFELKFPQTRHNAYSLKKKIRVMLNNEALWTSEIELQIAFKLSLGSNKDFEDARHIYNIFKTHLDDNLLRKHIRELEVEKLAERILWKKY